MSVYFYYFINVITSKKTNPTNPANPNRSRSESFRQHPFLPGFEVIFLCGDRDFIWYSVHTVQCTVYTQKLKKQKLQITTTLKTIN